MYIYTYIYNIIYICIYIHILAYNHDGQAWYALIAREWFDVAKTDCSHRKSETHPILLVQKYFTRTKVLEKYMSEARRIFTRPKVFALPDTSTKILALPVVIVTIAQ